jgi:hypothetical protein
LIKATGSGEHDDGGLAPANSASVITVPTANRKESVQYKNHQEKDLEMEGDDLVDALIAHPEIELKSLKEGMDHELEHTDNREIALKIAVDHLCEHADYYQRLKEMFPKDHSEYSLKIDDDNDKKEEPDDDEDDLGFSEDEKSLTVQAFKAGIHTDASGKTQTWTESDLDDIADKANKQIPTKPIPVCLGHPDDNSPAY